MGDHVRQITTDGVFAALLDAAGAILIGPTDIDATVERARALLAGAGRG